MALVFKQQLTDIGYKPHVPVIFRAHRYQSLAVAKGIGDALVFIRTHGSIGAVPASRMYGGHCNHERIYERQNDFIYKKWILTEL